MDCHFLPFFKKTTLSNDYSQSGKICSLNPKILGKNVQRGVGHPTIFIFHNARSTKHLAELWFLCSMTEATGSGEEDHLPLAHAQLMVTCQPQNCITSATNHQSNFYDYDRRWEWVADIPITHGVWMKKRKEDGRNNNFYKTEKNMSKG